MNMKFFVPCNPTRYLDKRYSNWENPVKFKYKNINHDKNNLEWLSFDLNSKREWPNGNPITVYYNELTFFQIYGFVIFINLLIFVLAVFFFYFRKSLFSSARNFNFYPTKIQIFRFLN